MQVKSAESAALLMQHPEVQIKCAEGREFLVQSSCTVKKCSKICGSIEGLGLSTESGLFFYFPALFN